MINLVRLVPYTPGPISTSGHILLNPSTGRSSCPSDVGCNMAQTFYKCCTASEDLAQKQAVEVRGFAIARFIRYNFGGAPSETEGSALHRLYVCAKSYPTEGLRATSSFRDMKPPTGCKPDWQGALCNVAAPCNIANAEGDGPACRCKAGYAGLITWTGNQPSGTCLAAQCPPNSRGDTIPTGCECIDGLFGTIGGIKDVCVKGIPCPINSLPVGGYVQDSGCSCKQGYAGDIVNRFSACVEELR